MATRKQAYWLAFTASLAAAYGLYVYLTDPHRLESLHKREY